MRIGDPRRGQATVRIRLKASIHDEGIDGQRKAVQDCRPAAAHSFVSFFFKRRIEIKPSCRTSLPFRKTCNCSETAGHCKPDSLPFDLHLDPIGVGEIHPVGLAAGFQSYRFQLGLDLVGIVVGYGVTVMVQPRLVTLEQGQEETLSIAQEAILLPTLTRTFSPRCLM